MQNKIWEQTMQILNRLRCENVTRDTAVEVPGYKDTQNGSEGISLTVNNASVIADEEITFDYSILDNENYSFECSCGSPNCRGTITGYDGKKPELQEKYKNYFVDHLQEKIDSNSGD